MYQSYFIVYLQVCDMILFFILNKKVLIEIAILTKKNIVMKYISLISISFPCIYKPSQMMK